MVLVGNFILPAAVTRSMTRPISKYFRSNGIRHKLFSDEFAKTPVYIIVGALGLEGNTTDKKPRLLFISRHRKREDMIIKVSIANV